MKQLLTGLALGCLLTCASQAYDVKTKALVPVEFKKTPSHKNLDLIQNGKLNFAIVTDKNAETKRNRTEKSIAPAVEILKETMERCTGKKPAELDVSETEKLKQYPYWIVVGENSITKQNGIDAAKLPDQGFEIKTFDKGILIVGNDSSLIEGYNTKPLEARDSSTGTKYGVYDFVERFLGVRYFFPGEYGSIYPNLETLSVTPVNYTDYPRFNSRGGIYYLGDSIRTDASKKFWEPYLGKLTAKDQYFWDRWRMGRTTPPGGSHCPRPERLAAAYPNQLKTIFYTSPGGNFYYNSKQHIGNYFDVVNLEFADILLGSYKKYYDSNGKIDEGGYTDGVNLSYASFGCCDTLMPDTDVLNHPVVKKHNLVSEKDLATCGMRNIYARFHQHLAKRMKEVLPGKKLYIMAYYNAQLAGTDPRWILPENVEVNLCLGPILAKGRNPKIAEQSRQIAKEWYESLGGRPVQQIWLYDVQSNHPFPRAVAGEFVGDVPKILGKYLGRTQMFYDHNSNAPGTIWFYYTSAYSAYRLMWNPDWDVEAGLGEHWNLLYGPKAGPLLKEFHAIVKQCVLKYYVPSEETVVTYPMAELNKLSAILKKAEQSLAPGTPEMQRFKLFSAPWGKAIESQKNQLTYERPVYSVHQLTSSETIKLDGSADEAVWKKIQPMPLMDPNGSGVKPKFPAELKLAWDKSGIYGMIATSYPVEADRKKAIWSNCSMELFFSPGLKKEVEYQIVFDPLKQLFFGTQRLLPIPQPFDSYWKAPGFRLESNVTKNNWQAEFYIPFTVFGAGIPKVYESWNFNAVRNKMKEPREYSGTAMTLGNNHNMNFYGIIKFAGKGE